MENFLKKALTHKYELPRLADITKYHLMYTALLSAVPLACGGLLVLLLSVFAKLNLYFFEVNGLILDDQVRDAYFAQVEFNVYSVIGYLFLQVLLTAGASYVVMRWATAPFRNAQKMIHLAMTEPSKLTPAKSWMSESPTFDRLTWLFCLRIRNGGESQVKEEVSMYGTNYPFLIKFLITFGILSVSTGFVLSIIMDSVYGRIIEMSLQLIKSSGGTNHYFLAQLDVLKDASNLTIIAAIVFYFFLGLQISRYMGQMLFVFSRAIAQDRFPLTLRQSDLYKSLAELMNKARREIRP